jgi:hypothetical protein
MSGHLLSDPAPRLVPTDARQRGRVHLWISSLNAYFYPYMIYY